MSVIKRFDSVLVTGGAGCIGRAVCDALRECGATVTSLDRNPKSCDLASFKVMDYVYGQEPFHDPFYLAKRESALIISSDCTCYGETCFCVAIGILPYPTEGFDINLSEVEGGYVAEAGSGKGEKIIKEYFKLFQAAEHHIEKRDSNRKKLKEDLLI